MSETITIMEADLSLARELRLALRNSGYTVHTYAAALPALHEWNTLEPDLVLLSLEVPDKNAFSVCSDIRKISSIPIIVLANSANVEHKVEILDLGADDYIVKPCDTREILARIRAFLRRSSAVPAVADSSVEYIGDYVEYPDLFINQTSYTVKYNGAELDLPPKELELLYCLASAPNRVFTREQLLDSVWGYDYIGDSRTVDVHIKRLRSKIKDHDTWAIQTVWGVGYKFYLDQ